MRPHQFTIRTYREGDEFAINEMFNEVFNQDRPIEHWYWKYRDNPYGAYKMALAFAPDGTLAAHYGGYPVKLFFCPDKESSKEFVVYQLGDKMTRRKYRGVGFGKSAILSLTFREFQKSYGKEVFFGYGFGTHHSLKFGLLFLDYVIIEPVPFREADIKELNTNIKVPALLRFLKRIKVREVQSIDDRWDYFFHKVAPAYRLLVKRDAEYLNWRYFKRPDRKYLVLAVFKKGVLTGWSVFFKQGQRMIWGDALFDPSDEDSVFSLLYYLLESQCCYGVDKIQCWFPARPSWWDDILRKLGFVVKTEPSNLHFTGPITDTNAQTLIKKYLYYTIGDSDLF